MKIKHAITKVRIGAPYNETLSYPFKVKEGQGYIQQGISYGRMLIAEFVETHFNHPTSKDYHYIESISEIKVDRFKI